MKRGKACGPDRLPVDLLAAFPSQLVAVFQPLMREAATSGREPKQWSGGRLVPLPKGRPTLQRTVASFRPIMVCGCVATSWRTWLRRLLEKRMEQYSLDTQRGGIAKCWR